MVSFLSIGIKKAVMSFFVADLKVVCPEDAAYRKNWITAKQLEHLARSVVEGDYGQ